MTPASPLSRLEKLAEEKYGSYGDAEPNIKCFMEGVRATLSALSEPGEACGPRLMVCECEGPTPDVKCYMADAKSEYPDNYFKPEFYREYCDSAELLQARATTETLRHELKMGHSCALKLASSEARVRILEKRIEGLLEERS